MRMEDFSSSFADQIPIGTRKNIYENYRLFGNALTKSFANFPLPKKVERIAVWRGAKLLACPGRSHVSVRRGSYYNMGLQPAACQFVLCCPRTHL